MYKRGKMTELVWEVQEIRLEYSIRKKYHLFQYTIEKIKKECVHSTRMPPLPTNSWIYFLLHYGITINFTISYFIKGHNSGTSKVKSVKIVLILPLVDHTNISKLHLIWLSHTQVIERKP
jgi:hypothetical protein